MVMQELVKQHEIGTIAMFHDAFGSNSLYCFIPILEIDGLVRKKVKHLTHNWDHFPVGACKAKNGRCASLCGSSERQCAVVCVGWYQKAFISTSFIQVDT